MAKLVTLTFAFTCISLVILEYNYTYLSCAIILIASCNLDFTLFGILCTYSFRSSHYVYQSPISAYIIPFI